MWFVTPRHPPACPAAAKIPQQIHTPPPDPPKTHFHLQAASSEVITNRTEVTTIASLSRWDSTGQFSKMTKNGTSRSESLREIPPTDLRHLLINPI